VHLGEALAAAAEFAEPSRFEQLGRHLDPAWIERALRATGTTTIRRRRLPAEQGGLAGGLGARVEIERLGPKEVAVKVQGRRGPPSPEEVTQIRQEIRAKGLRLSALLVS
jgi:Insertion element 4 transposase N-terminal